MIIDTHTHFGKPAEPNKLLYRTERPDVYKRLAIPEGVTGTVVVEARRGPDEIRWLIDLAAEDPFIVGIVGDINPCSNDFADGLERFADIPLFCGVRLHDECCDGLGGLRGAAGEGGLQRLLCNVEKLAAKDLELDVHMTHERFDALASLVERLPELRVVVNHIAESRPLSGKAANPRWAEDIRMIAEHPRVYCKVSGLVQMARTVPAPGNVDFYRPTLDVLWDAFGEDRLVYGSNWPQIEAVSDFGTAHRIVADYFGEKGEVATSKFFWKNASAAYRFVRPSSVP